MKPEKKVLKLTAQYFKIKSDIIVSKSRKRKLVTAREYSYFYIRKRLKLTLSDIGKLFNRDHTTVLNGLDNIQNYKDLNTEDYTLYLKYEEFIDRNIDNCDLDYSIDSKEKLEMYESNLQAKYESKLKKFRSDLERYYMGKTINRTLLDKIFK